MAYKQISSPTEPEGLCRKGEVVRGEPQVEAGIGGFPSWASYRRRQQAQRPKAAMRVGRGGPKAAGEAAGCECRDHHQDWGREEGWARTGELAGPGNHGRSGAQLSF